MKLNIKDYLCTSGVVVREVSRRACLVSRFPLGPLPNCNAWVPLRLLGKYQHAEDPMIGIWAQTHTAKPSVYSQRCSSINHIPLITRHGLWDRKGIHSWRTLKTNMGPSLIVWRGMERGAVDWSIRVCPSRVDTERRNAKFRDCEIGV